jgi:sulfite oxidase
MPLADGRQEHDRDGLNAGGPRAGLAGAHITPPAAFFTRSHAPVPTIDAARWRLRVDGLVERELSLSLDDLCQWPTREVPSTLVCAGLRRNELLQVAPLPGELPWGAEAASHAIWTGIALRDVLAAAGVQPGAAHVEFVGLDAVERRGERFGFGGSITLEKAQDPDVLLATAMNGQPLSPAHGFPVRAVVPGWIGARSVKWLGRISVLREPSQNYFQTAAYRVLRTPDPARPGDVSGGEALSTITLNSVILTPGVDEVIAAGVTFTMRGWAIGTDGNAITRVEYSLDDGVTWAGARLVADRERWSWTRWDAEVLLQAGAHTLVVRATDAAGHQQPTALRDAWHVKGYCNNALHRVSVVATR